MGSAPTIHGIAESLVRVPIMQWVHSFRGRGTKNRRHSHGRGEARFVTFFFWIDCGSSAEKALLRSHGRAVGFLWSKVPFEAIGVGTGDAFVAMKTRQGRGLDFDRQKWFRCRATGNLAHSAGKPGSISGLGNGLRKNYGSLG